jgi:hypothetical protein
MAFSNDVAGTPGSTSERHDISKSIVQAEVNSKRVRSSLEDGSLPTSSNFLQQLNLILVDSIDPIYMKGVVMEKKWSTLEFPPSRIMESLRLLKKENMIVNFQQLASQGQDIIPLLDEVCPAIIMESLCLLKKVEMVSNILQLASQGLGIAALLDQVSKLLLYICSLVPF